MSGTHTHLEQGAVNLQEVDRRQLIVVCSNVRHLITIARDVSIELRQWPRSARVATDEIQFLTLQQQNHSNVKTNMQKKD